MYRITVNTSGKYNNVTLGPRYCFRKKTAKELIDLFFAQECEIMVEKLVRCCDDVFCFSDGDEDDKVLNYYANKILA